MIRRIAATLFALAVSFGAYAQQFPTKPVKIIVPFPAGQATDLAADPSCVDLPATDLLDLAKKLDA